MPERATAPSPSPAGEPRRSRLGEILVANGSITPEQLDHALAQQAVLKLPIGQVLLKLDYVTDETMRQALGLQLNVPYLDLENVMIDRSLARVINPTFARRHALLPVATVGRTLTVAMDDPTAVAVVQDLTRLTGFSITVVTSSSRAIHRAFRRLYDDVPDLVEARRDDADAAPVRSQLIGAPPVDRVATSPVDAALADVLAHAHMLGATDVHLECLPAAVVVAMRVNGVIQPAALGPLQARLDEQAPVVAGRLRGLADGEPVDALIDAGGDRTAALDLRVSRLPARRGDSVSIRLLDRRRTAEPLEAAGLSPEAVRRIAEMLSRRSGVVVICGPAHAGLARTLHGALLRLTGSGARVVTAEDPVTAVNDAVIQVEVGGRAGRPFAETMRAILDHDADVVMVSDLVDGETARLAFQAAERGSLVLAGITTACESAADAVPVLFDRGLSGATLGRTLVGVVAQRSVRLRCTPCGGDACQSCGGSGWSGSALVADVWLPDADDLRRLGQDAPLGDIRQGAARTTVPMGRDARALLDGAATTLDELTRVLPASAVAALG